MCGIVGIIRADGKVEDPMAILSMRESLKHRGPDSKATYISPDGKVVFGHRRLSLVGLDRKATIMSIPKKNNFKHEVAIIFNGEIYNFKELKQYFTKKGYVSVSPSDFEVIIFAWQEWGKKCVDHLIGEFVFIVYDEETKEVFIARDRTGVKPLFYATSKSGELIFGSEPKAVLAHPGISKEIDHSSIAEFLLMGHTFAAGSHNERSSYFKDVKQFPPAHYATFNTKGLNFTRYYELPFTAKPEKNKQKNIERIKTALTNSVADRIPKEVPVSIGLSGGLDSSIIAAVTRRNHYSYGMLASCVRYTGDSNEDYKHAKLLAKIDGFKLVGPVLSPSDMIGLIDDCIRSADGPVDSIRRMAMLSNYKELASHGYRATLIGEGADEMHLGYYHKFPGLKVDKEFCKTAASVRQLFSGRVDYVKSFFTSSFLKTVDFKSIIKEIVKENYERCKVNDPVVRMQHFYAKRFLQYLEDSNDRASMSNSVEARLPFLDPELIKASLAVPQEQNVTVDSEKEVLRAAFKDILPREIYRRNKAAFPANEDMELHKKIAKTFEKEIRSANPKTWKILDKKFLLQLNKKFNKRISELEREFGKNKGGHILTSWLAISGPVDLRTNQIFSALTLIRWLQDQTI